MTKGKRKLKVSSLWTGTDIYRMMVTVPLVRLSGKWVKEAGIPEGSYITVTNPTQGTIVITREV